MKSKGVHCMLNDLVSASASCKSPRHRKVPWHFHNHVQDTFYVIEGHIRLFLRTPDEDIGLGPGDVYRVPPLRPHLVRNDGESSATFLVLQGPGEYDYVPLT